MKEKFEYLIVAVVTLVLASLLLSPHRYINLISLVALNPVLNILKFHFFHSYDILIKASGFGLLFGGAIINFKKYFEMR